MVLVLLAALVGLPAARTTAQESWEYSPYRIQIWVAHEHTADMPASVRELLKENLVQHCRRAAGASWRIEVSDAPEWLADSIVYALDRLSSDDVMRAIERIDRQNAGEGEPFALPTGGSIPTLLAAVSQATLQDVVFWFEQQRAAEDRMRDKVVLVAVRQHVGGLRVEAREVDIRTRTMGRLAFRDVAQRSMLDRHAAGAVLEAFSPLVRVEDSRGRTATVRVRANGLVLDEDSPSHVGVGDVLQPVLRQNDRTGQAQIGGILVLPWHYLNVTHPGDGTLLECQVNTAGRNQLAGRGTSRTERYALGVHPMSGRTSTVLRLIDDTENEQPLEGYEVFGKLPRMGEEDQPPAVPLGRTDWRGLVTIEQNEFPLRLVYVMNGNYPLARLPIVPGLDAEIEAPLTSDDKRLEAEAFVKGMEITVMDLVARQKILSTRIEMRIAEGKIDEAKTLLEEFRGLPNRQELEIQITNRQASLASTNPREQRRIDQLLGGTRILLAKYLDPELVPTLSRRVEQAASGTPTSTPAAGSDTVPTE